MTDEAFPTAADPSSVEWWESKERRSRARQSKTDYNGSSSAHQSRSTASPDLQRLKDFAVLGLDDEASVNEIREAYRRMAKVHHPDRFVSLGPEAVQAAEVSFRRIQAAYDRLVPA